MSAPFSSSGSGRTQSTLLKSSTGAVDVSIVESPKAIATELGQPQWNSSSYSAPTENEAPPDSPTKVASGARSSAELLRRLSLVDGNRPTTLKLDPTVDYPALRLTGRIISATFCIPHTLGFRSGCDWVRYLQTNSIPQTNIALGHKTSSWHLGPVRVFYPSLRTWCSMGPHACRLDWRNQTLRRASNTTCVAHQRKHQF